jgi:hypothetical protein
VKTSKKRTAPDSTPFNAMTPKGKREIVNALQKLLAFVENQWPMGTCPSCDHFKDGHCKQWDARPPRDKWDEGCDHWSDPIPW